MLEEAGIDTTVILISDHGFHSDHRRPKHVPIEKPDDDREKAVRETLRELDYNLARTYMDAQRHLDALGIVEKLSNRWPDDHRFPLKRAECLHALDRLGEARQILETTLAHYLLGVALHRLNRLPEAVQALEIAVSQNPNFPEAYRRLAYIFKKRFDDPKQALAYGKRAQEATERLKSLKQLTRATPATKMPHAKPQRREEFRVYFITLRGLAALREKKTTSFKSFQNAHYKMGLSSAKKFSRSL